MNNWNLMDKYFDYLAYKAKRKIRCQISLITNIKASKLDVFIKPSKIEKLNVVLDSTIVSWEEFKEEMSN